MRYSELVQAIRDNTLEDLIVLLSITALAKLSGSTRDAYLFDTHVVKIARHGCEHHNLLEYNFYCHSKAGMLNVPIVFTRCYNTTDGHVVLIQERLLRVFELVLYERTLGRNMYQHIADRAEQDRIEKELLLAGVPYRAFGDGLQAGYNRQNRVVFFDISRMQEA